jgi:hypothetical protein
MCKGGAQVGPPVWDQTGQVEGARLDHHGAVQHVRGHLPLVLGKGRVGGVGEQEAWASPQQRLGVGLAGGHGQHADGILALGDVPADLRVLRRAGLKLPAELGQ